LDYAKKNYLEIFTNQKIIEMAKTQTLKSDSSKSEMKKKCGIIMPISIHPDYPQEHWKDVLNILIEAISETDFEPSLVSDDMAVGLIHDRIVTNVYNNEIVVCDVSSKNPNVMFELGLRLAFDKPTIIIKDELTGYSFDTGIIEHITYPYSLRFGQIVDFKEELIKRIDATYKRSTSESHYSPFLKSFGKNIVPATLHETEVPEGKYILEQLERLRFEIRSLRLERNDNSNYDRNRYFKVSDSSKKQMLDNILNSLNIGNLNLNDKESFEIIRQELSRKGIDISLNELKPYICQLKDISISKDKNIVA
jgi:hypothetical protein